MYPLTTDVTDGLWPIIMNVMVRQLTSSLLKSKITDQLTPVSRSHCQYVGLHLKRHPLSPANVQRKSDRISFVPELEWRIYSPILPCFPAWSWLEPQLIHDSPGSKSSCIPVLYPGDNPASLSHDLSRRDKAALHLCLQVIASVYAELSTALVPDTTDGDRYGPWFRAELLAWLMPLRM